MEFTPNGEYLIISQASGFQSGGRNAIGKKYTSSTELFSTSNGKKITLDATGTTNDIQGSSFAISPDGNTLVTAHDDKIYFCDMIIRKPYLTVDYPPGLITTMKFSPDGKLLVVGNMFGRISFLNVADGASIAELEGHGGWINDLVFSRDATTLVTSSNDGTIRIWGIEP